MEEFLKQYEEHLKTVKTLTDEQRKEMVLVRRKAFAEQAAARERFEASQQ